jgi:hypothetical protein
MALLLRTNDAHNTRLCAVTTAQHCVSHFDAWKTHLPPATVVESAREQAGIGLRLHA